jgi:hypothetical protein
MELANAWAELRLKGRAAGRDAHPATVAPALMIASAAIALMLDPRAFAAMPWLENRHAGRSRQDRVTPSPD